MNRVYFFFLMFEHFIFNQMSAIYFFEFEEMKKGDNRFLSFFYFFLVKQIDRLID